MTIVNQFSSHQANIHTLATSNVSSIAPLDRAKLFYKRSNQPLRVLVGQKRMWENRGHFEWQAAKQIITAQDFDHFVTQFPNKIPLADLTKTASRCSSRKQDKEFIRLLNIASKRITASNSKGHWKKLAELAWEKASANRSNLKFCKKLLKLSAQFYRAYGKASFNANAVIAFSALYKKRAHWSTKELFEQAFLTSNNDEQRAWALQAIGTIYHLKCLALDHDTHHDRAHFRARRQKGLGYYDQAIALLEGNKQQKYLKENKKLLSSLSVKKDYYYDIAAKCTRKKLFVNGNIKSPNIIWPKLVPQQNRSR